MIQLATSHEFREGNTIIERTATVKDLMAFLGQFPDDMPVIATWEGVIRGIGNNESEQGKVYQGQVESEALIIDAEGYLYK